MPGPEALALEESGQAELGLGELGPEALALEEKGQAELGLGDLD